MAMEALLRLAAKPTAVLCFNDLTAVGAALAAQQAGLSVPDDISIAGIDNIPLSEFIHPPITTVDLRAAEQGRIAVQAMIDMLDGHPGELHTIVQPSLVIRNSCASPA